MGVWRGKTWLCCCKRCCRSFFFCSLPRASCAEARLCVFPSPPHRQMPSTSRRTSDDAGLVALHRARFVAWAPAPVVALAATHDGSALAAARDDGGLELLDTETWACVAVSVVGEWLAGGERARGRCQLSADRGGSACVSAYFPLLGDDDDTHVPSNSGFEMACSTRADNHNFIQPCLSPQRERERVAEESRVSGLDATTKLKPFPAPNTPSTHSASPAATAPASHPWPG